VPSNPKVINSAFYGNVATGSGGGIYNDSRTNPLLVNVVMSGNAATGTGSNGGGISSWGSIDTPSYPALVNVTLSGNSASSCGGGIASGWYSRPIISNSIFWGNTAGAFAQICNGQEAVATVSHSIVQGGYGGEGNLDEDPLFVRLPGPGLDGVWDTADDDLGDFHPKAQPLSPAIDRGHSADVPADVGDLDGDGDTAEPAPLDLAGLPRFINHPRHDAMPGSLPGVDMGAYESQLANQAPLLDTGGDPRLDDVAEEATDPACTSVGTILSRSAGGHPITDPDPAALEGIALVAADGSHGVWEFSTNSGASYQPLGAVSDATARVLTTDAGNCLRFLPAPDFVGTATLTFRAWDQSDGYANGAPNVAAIPNGGSTAYSTGLESASITVTNTNDPPTDLTLTPAQVAENLPPGTTVGTLSTTDPDPGDSFTYSLVSGEGSTDNGSFSIPSGNTLRAAVSFDYEAKSSYSIRVRTTDSGGLTKDKAFTVTITNANEAPVCQPLLLGTSEDTSAEVGPSCTDVETDPLTYAIASQPTHGTAAVMAGKLTYTPTADYNGADSFTYMANDGALDSDAASVTVTVAPADDAPVAMADSYTTTEDVPLLVPAPGVLANDSDADDDPLSAVLVNGPMHGTLVLNADGSFTYTPDANWAGGDQFDYSAGDGTAQSEPARVSITVTPVNDAPVAVDDAYSVAAAKPLAVQPPGVLGNDSDAEGDVLEATLVSGPAHGQLDFNAQGHFSYLPDAGFRGNDSFTYKVSDGQAESTTATVTLTVGGPAVAFALGGVSVDEGSGPAHLTVVLDAPSQETVTVACATADGSATAGPDYASVAGRTLTFNPGQTSRELTVSIADDDLVENDETFTVSLSAPVGAVLGSTSSATVTINDNDAPGQRPSDVHVYLPIIVRGQ